MIFQNEFWYVKVVSKNIFRNSKITSEKRFSKVMFLYCGKQFWEGNSTILENVFSNIFFLSRKSFSITHSSLHSFQNMFSVKEKTTTENAFPNSFHAPLTYFHNSFSISQFGKTIFEKLLNVYCTPTPNKRTKWKPTHLH